MNLKDILAIGGYAGLFKYISQAKNGIIVESISDKKRMPAYASFKVSALEDIAIFSETGEVPLGDIFSKIFEKESGGRAPDGKSSPDKLVAYFEEILPDYDKKRVYTSDIKKVFTWYNILQEHNMLNLPEEKKAAAAEEEEEKTEEVKKAEEAEKLQKAEKKPKSSATKKTSGKNK